MTKPEPKDEQLIVKNRRATFDYDIADRFEAGMVLAGSEVKSMRAGKVDVSDAYVSIDRGEAWLKQMFVAPFEQASAFPHETRRNRRLLMHKKEIEALDERLSRDGATAVPMRLYFKKGRVKVEIGEIDVALSRGGMTAVPLRLYFKKGRAKVEFALAKGKKTFDKRADIKKKDDERETRAAIRGGKR